MLTIAKLIGNISEIYNYSELELLVIKDMCEQGYEYPFSPADIKAFWAKKGIE